MQGLESQLGISTLVLSPAPLPWPLLPPQAARPPQTSVPLAGRLDHSASQLGRNRENCLPGGRGMAEVTSGGPLLKETPRTSPTGFPRGIMVHLGK